MIRLRSTSGRTSSTLRYCASYGRWQHSAANATAPDAQLSQDMREQVRSVWVELLERARWATGQRVFSTAPGASAAHKQKVRNLRPRSRISWSEVPSPADRTYGALCEVWYPHKGYGFLRCGQPHEAGVRVFCRAADLVGGASSASIDKILRPGEAVQFTIADGMNGQKKASDVRRVFGPFGEGILHGHDRDILPWLRRGTGTGGHLYAGWVSSWDASSGFGTIRFGPDQEDEVPFHVAAGGAASASSFSRAGDEREEGALASPPGGQRDFVCTYDGRDGLWMLGVGAMVDFEVADTGTRHERVSHVAVLQGAPRALAAKEMKDKGHGGRHRRPPLHGNAAQNRSELATAFAAAWRDLGALWESAYALRREQEERHAAEDDAGASRSALIPPPPPMAFRLGLLAAFHNGRAHTHTSFLSSSSSSSSSASSSSSPPPPPPQQRVLQLLRDFEETSNREMTASERDRHYHSSLVPQGLKVLNEMEQGFGSSEWESAPALSDYVLAMKACDDAGAPRETIEAFTRLVGRGQVAIERYHAGVDQHGGGGTQEKKKEEEEEEQAKDSDLAFKEAHVQLECAAGAAAAAADARRQAQRERRFFVERQRRALRAVRPDLEAYGLAMRALGQLGQTQSSLQLLDMMRAAKLGVEPTVELYNDALRACLRCDPPSPTAAFSVLDDMSRWELAPNAETFTVAMEVCAAAAKRSTHPVASETIRRRILALFDAMNAPGLALDAPTDPTATSLSAYGLKDDDDDEEEDNDDEEDGDDGSRMPNSQGSPSTKERHSRRGHSKQPLPNMEAFTLALEAAAKNGRWQRAVKLMRSMTSAAATTTTTTEGPSSSVESVHLLGDEGGPFVSRAAAFITQEHWANVISACARARPPRWREALALLDEMRHSSDAAAPHVVLEGSPPFSSPSPSSSSSSSSSPPPPALLPDTVCYNAALSALARAGRWQEALSLLVEMRIQFERYGPGTYFSSNENAAHGRPTGLPASSSAASMRFDSCYDVQTFNTAMHACAAGGAVREALALLERMKDEGQSDDSGIGSDEKESLSIGSSELGVVASEPVTGIFPAHEAKAAAEMEIRGRRRGRRKSTGRFVSNCHAPAPDVVSFNTAISACAGAGWWEKALELLDEMREGNNTAIADDAAAASISSSIAPDTTSYNWALYSFLLSPPELQQRSKLVQGIFQRMEADGVQPNTVTFSRAALALQVAGFAPPTTGYSHLRAETLGGGGAEEPSFCEGNALLEGGDGRRAWLEGLRVSQTSWRAVEEVYERAVEQEILSPPPLDTTEINLNRFSLPLAQVAMVAHLKRLAEAARQAVPAPAPRGGASGGECRKGEDRVVGGGDVVDGPYRKAAPAWQRVRARMEARGAVELVLGRYDLASVPLGGEDRRARDRNEQRQLQPAMAEFLRTSFSPPIHARMRIKKKEKNARLIVLASSLLEWAEAQANHGTGSQRGNEQDE